MNEPQGIDALRALDAACYADQEAGGDGWALAGAVANLLDLPDGRAAWGLLRALADKGLVEGRTSPDPNRLRYAPSEAGADLLLELDKVG